MRGWQRSHELAERDDPVLAAAGFSLVARPRVRHTVALLLGAAGVVAGVVGFERLAAVPVGGEPTRWVPILVLGLAAYLIVYGALGVARGLRTWVTPDGRPLDRARHRLPGGVREADVIHGAFVAGAPPRLPEGRRGPVVVALHADRRRTTLWVTVRVAGPTPSTWPLVTLADAALARHVDGSGSADAANPIV